MNKPVICKKKTISKLFVHIWDRIGELEGTWKMTRLCHVAEL